MNFRKWPVLFLSFVFWRDLTVCLGLRFRIEEESSAIISNIPKKTFEDQRLTLETVQTWLRWALDRHMIAHPRTVTLIEFTDQLAKLEPQELTRAGEPTASFMQAHLKQKDGKFIIGREEKTKS